MSCRGAGNTEIFDGDYFLAIPDLTQRVKQVLKTVMHPEFFLKKMLGPTLTRTNKKMNEFDEEMKNTLLM
jgi:hypothetical protein